MIFNSLPKYLRYSLIIVYALVPLHSMVSAPKELLKRQIYSDPKFSPDGKHLSVVMKNEDGQKMLGVRDLETRKTRVSTITSPDSPEWERVKSVEAYSWIDSENILVKTSWYDGEDALSYVRAGNSNPRYLESDGKYSIVDPLPGTSKYVIVERPPNDEYGKCSVLKLDINDRKFESVLYSCESKTFEAYTDRKGELRLIKKEDDGELAWHALDAESNSWKKLKLSPWVRIHGFDYDPDKLWVAGYFGDPDPGVYLYSFSEDRAVGRFATHPKYSIDSIGHPLFCNNLEKVVGMHIDAAGFQTQWTHQKLANYQKQIDGLFKDSTNRISAWSDDLAKVVVDRNFSDRPPEAFLVDFSTNKVEFLYVNGSAIEKGQTSSTEHSKFENRDGIRIDAFFTPVVGGKKSAPLVIMIRGNPWGSMDHLQWNAEDHYFSAKGYSVLRLNFRGSGGYRGEHGLDWKSKEDALKAIQDLEDAVQWIKEQGKADTSRVAIVATGCAGWLASYASIASPNTFKAIACNVGIYDLLDYRDTSGKDPIQYMVGNIPFAKDDNGLSQDDLRELSPSFNTSKLTSAFFVSYGRYSPTSYSKHVSRFVSEARKAGAKMEKPYIGDWYGKDIGNDDKYATYYEKVTAFLKRNL